MLNFNLSTIMWTLYTTTANNSTTNGDWDVGDFLNNVNKLAQDWGGRFLMLLGVVAVVYGVYQVVTGLMSHGKKQVAWPQVILTIIVGGGFMIGGFNLAKSVSSVGNKTIERLGKNGADSKTTTPPKTIIATSDYTIFTK